MFHERLSKLIVVGLNIVADSRMMGTSGAAANVDTKLQHAIATDVFLIHHCFAVASPNAGRHCRLLVCSAVTLPAPPLLCRTPTAAEGLRTLVSVAPPDANRSCSAELLPPSQLPGVLYGVLSGVIPCRGIEPYTLVMDLEGSMEERERRSKECGLRKAVAGFPKCIFGRFLKDKGGWAWKSDERYGKNVEVD
nr:hypothetical protein Iba_chr03aCG4010 [Ipomoea batatas]